MIGYGVIRCFVEGLRTDSLYLYNYHYAIINIYPYNNHKKYTYHNCNP